MNKHIVYVNGKMYMFYLKNNKLNLFEYVNGRPVMVNPKEKNED